MGVFRTNYKNKSDEELIALLTSGENRAFDEIYQRYSNKMLFFFYRMFNGDEEKSQDFLHDMFLKVLEKPHLFDPQRKLRFSTWIYTIASNMCKNEYRNQKVRQVVTNDIDMSRFSSYSEKVSQNYDKALFQQLLQQELENCSHAHRTAFILRFQDGMAIKEISAILECSEGTIKSRIFYTLKRLSEKLKIFDPNCTQEVS